LRAQREDRVKIIAEVLQISTLQGNACPTENKCSTIQAKSR